MPRESNNGFEEWGGYMGAKITKLEEQFAVASDPFRQSELFAGISIFVNGLTNPSTDELKRIMMVHGGTFHHYERAHTTYIIASNLPDVKVRNMNTSKIIRADWIVDCLREKRILDYTRYLLYTNQKTSQPRLIFNNAKKKDPHIETVTAIMHDLDKLNKNLATTAAKAEQKDFKTCIKTDTASLGAIAEQTGEENALGKSTVSVVPPLPVASDTKNLNIPAGGSAARTAVDPKFLSEFYNNSRLHHIATLGNGFKQYISNLRDKHDASAGFPTRALLLAQMTANGVQQLGDASYKSDICVLHIDMDCFFVSVGLRQHPELVGLPVAVTHSKGGAVALKVPYHPSANRQAEMNLLAERFEHQHNELLADKVRVGFNAKMSLSEIASASYEARAKGVRNGMFVGQALSLCPELRTLPYDFEGYREVAFTLYDILAQYTLNIEAVSCDELFVDLTDLLTELRVACMDFVSAIRDEVRRKTSCPCSAGVGANKLQARMATKRAKPDGQYHLANTNVQSYMMTIPIGELPGVGSSTRHTLEQAHALTCGDLQRMSLARLRTLVGNKFGETLHKFCRGIDNRQLTYDQVRKSVSAEVNYGIRFAEQSELDMFLRQLCKEVHTRLTEIRRKTKCVTLKLMIRAKDAPLEASKFMGHGVCDNMTKSLSLTEYTNELAIITRSVLSIMNTIVVPPNELRGIGIQLSKLNEPGVCVGRATIMNARPNRIMHLFSKAATGKLKEVELKDYGSRSCSTTFTPIMKMSSHATPPVAAKIQAVVHESLNPNLNDKPAVLKQLKRTECYRVNGFRNEECTEPYDKRRRLDLLAGLCAKSNIKVHAERETLYRVMVSSLAEQTKDFGMQCEGTASELGPNLDENYLLSSSSRNAEQRRLWKQFDYVDENLCGQFNLPVDFDAAGDVYDEYMLPKSGISMDNIFAQNDSINLLLDWVRDCPCPEDYDTVLISDHARQFVRARALEQLYDPLLFLCRLIKYKTHSAEECFWHRAFQQIIEAVHEEMYILNNGLQLYLGTKLNCGKCNCSV